MLNKALMIAAALAATAVAAATGVVALAFALYALLRGLLGPPGAAACVAVAAALCVGLAGLIAAQSADRHEPAQEPEPLNLTQRLMELVREKPIAAGGVAVAAGLMALRNPKVIGVVLRTLLEAWPAVSLATSKPVKRTRR